MAWMALVFIKFMKVDVKSFPHVLLQWHNIHCLDSNLELIILYCIGFCKMHIGVDWEILTLFFRMFSIYLEEW